MTGTRGKTPWMVQWSRVRSLVDKVGLWVMRSDFMGRYLLPRHHTYSWMTDGQTRV